MKLIKFIILFGLALLQFDAWAQTEEEKNQILANTNAEQLENLQQQWEEDEGIRTQKLELNKITEEFPETKDVNGSIGYLYDISDDNEPIYMFPLVNFNPSVKTTGVYSLRSGGSIGIDLHGQGLYASVCETFSGGKNRVNENLDVFQNGGSRVIVGAGITSSSSGHATEVAAALIGGGNQNLLRNCTGDNHKREGVADLATAITNGPSNTYVASDILTYGALFSNHSYAAFNPNSYNSSFDQVTYNSPYHASFVANGNGWLNPYATSKNVISTGKLRPMYKTNGTNGWYKDEYAGVPHVSGTTYPDFQSAFSVAIPDGGVASRNISVYNVASHYGTTVNSSLSLTVRLGIQHTDVSDLDVYLVGPGSCGAVKVIDGATASGVNYEQAYFSNIYEKDINTYTAPYTNLDMAMAGNFNTPPSVSALYTSSVPTTALNGCPIAGTWKVVVGDNTTNSISGTLVDAQIAFDSPFSTSILSQRPYVIRPHIVTPNRYYTGQPSGSCIVGGTSFASPMSCGGGMLLQELYKDYNPNFMRSPTLKALMVHDAKPAGLAGPDFTFGHGVLDLEACAKTIINDNLTTRIIEDDLTNNSTYTLSIPSNGVDPIKATLCWLEPASNNLINDLDIRVSSFPFPDVEPWKIISSDISVGAVKGDNTVDEVEVVEIPNPLLGQTYTITISHKGTLSDGTNSIASLPFSLIVSGINDCSQYSQNNLLITTDVTSNTVSPRFAIQNLEATNTIEANATAKYVAGTEVLLSTDFDALASSKFDGIIGDCIDASINKKDRYKKVKRDIVTAETLKSISSFNSSEPLVYPNPNNGTFKVDLEGLGSGTFDIRDLTGAIVHQDNFVSNEVKEVVLRNSVANGIYFIRINSDKGVSTKKLIIER